MGRRSRKPPVKPEERRAWLRRYEEDGESPPQIAAADSFDVRTVRKQIDLARQEREVREARSTVLRNALERHYADLCSYARSLDADISGTTPISSPLMVDHIRSALRQHLPRSPIWTYLSKQNSLNEKLTQLKTEVNIRLKEVVESDSTLEPILSAGETEVIPGIVEILAFQVDQWAKGYNGLNVEDNLVTKPAEPGFVNLRYGFSQMGKVKEKHVAIIREVLQDLESLIVQWEEYSALQKLCADLSRLKRNLRDELAIIILRRIVPGRCKYCPV